MHQVDHAAAQPTAVCLYADGEQGFTGAELAVLTLKQHEPSWHIHFFVPESANGFQDWLRARGVDVHLAPKYTNGFNAKPFILQRMFDDARGDVVWFDSDMLLAGAVGPKLAQFSRSAVVVAENPPSNWPEGTGPRAAGWGFSVGRREDRTVNSCFIRFTQDHRRLVDAWVDAVERADYVAAQKAHWSKRPFYFLGDQDALGAVLGSEAFSGLQLGMLKSGTDIAQCFFEDGFSWRDRLRATGGNLPPIIHAQGMKPWASDELPLYLDVGTYKLAARRYAGSLSDTAWLKPRSRTAALMTAMFAGDAALTGLPMAVMTAAKSRLRRFVRGTPQQLGLFTDAP